MVIVTGPSCSGKSTFGRLSRERGLQVVESTDVVKVAFRESRKDNEDIIDFCVRVYRDYGEETFAVKNCERFLRENFDIPRLVCIGCRAAGEIEYFRKVLSVQRVIGIYADTSIRHYRGILRNREDCAHDITEFIRHDMREYSMGLAGLFSRSLDSLFLNNGSMVDFEDGVERQLM